MQTVGSAARGSDLSSRSRPRCWPSGSAPSPGSGRRASQPRGSRPGIWIAPSGVTYRSVVTASSRTRTGYRGSGMREGGYSAMPGWTTRISSAWAVRRRRLSYTSIRSASIRLADARWIESSVRMVRGVSSAARRRPSLTSTRRHDSRSRAILGRRCLATQAQLDLPSDVAVDGWNLPKDRGRTYQGKCVLQRSMSQMLTRTRYLKTVDENGRQSPTCLKGRDACTHAYRIEFDQ
jgi:hypothetical protein